MKGMTLTAALILGASTTTKADFALRDGDTVVFLGDSITAAQTYGRIVENYTRLRFPGRNVHFINAGWGGDTAAGGLKRLQADVFDQGATVLIVAYGVNDIGWGLHADEAHKKVYLDAVRGIVAACKERGVRVFIASAAVTGEDPDLSEKGFLQGMCDEGMAIAKEAGTGAIDIMRTMRDVQRRVKAHNAALPDEKGRDSLHAADGVHLNELGQRAMAFAILKGLGAPAEVSSVVIEVKDEARAVEARGCALSDVAGDARGVSFTRLDQGLPLNLGVFGPLCYRFIPIPEELDRYMLTVRGLVPGEYAITADGRALGTFTAESLERGLNLCSATADGWQTGGPWDAQANLLIKLTDARGEVAQARKFAGLYIAGHPNRGTFDTQANEIDRKLEALQQTLVKPAPYRFEVRPAPDGPVR
jgi:lysophospholipase L1-like esterase